MLLALLVLPCRRMGKTGLGSGTTCWAQALGSALSELPGVVRVRPLNRTGCHWCLSRRADEDEEEEESRGVSTSTSFFSPPTIRTSIEAVLLQRLPPRRWL